MSKDIKGIMQKAGQSIAESLCGEKFINENEVLEMLNVDRQFLRRMRYRKEIAYYRMGFRTIKYKRSDIQKFIDKSFIGAA